MSGAVLTKVIAGHFDRLNRDSAYLDQLAAAHPNVYAQLVSKCIPAAVAIDVGIHAINLGDAMAAAAQRVIDAAAPVVEGEVILEHDPVSD